MEGYQWLLGDIIYSTPVVIGRPNIANVSPRFEDVAGTGQAVHYGHYVYWRSRDAQWHRPKVIYVGANDGMLHAFLMGEDPGTGVYEHKPNESTVIGHELWAYIPSNLLTELQVLAKKDYGLRDGTCQHRAMVDLSPKYKEVFFHNGSWDDWHTILLGGQRGGGDIYFAIDVTDPHDPAIVWEYSILKDLVVKFDVARAWPAFKDACGNFSYHPGEFPHGQCEAPLIPSAIFNGTDKTSRCDGCLAAEEDREACIVGNQMICADEMEKPNPKYGSIEECLNDKCPEVGSCEGILQHYIGDNWFKPFAVPELYEAAKTLPMAWSRPDFGRIKWPDGMSICTEDPKMGPGGLCGVNCDAGGSSTDAIITNHPRRTVAFVGVAMRLVDENIEWWYDEYPRFFADGMRGALEQPTMMVLDVELGVNLFRYVWPQIMFAARDHPNDASAINLIPVKKRGCDANGENCKTTVPYALSDALAVDLWDGVNDIADWDGFTDTVYIGDMNGLFYEVKINFDAGDPNPGVLINLWHTKPIDDDSYDMNIYRSDRQPITARPTVAWEEDLEHVRVVFGTGKFETIDGDATDKTDSSRMSFYNLRRKVEYPAIDPGGPYGGQFGSSGSAFYFETKPMCLDPADYEPPDYRCVCPPLCGSPFTCPTSECPAGCDATYPDITGSTNYSVLGCKWTKSDLTNDCCEDTCPDDTCWTCIFDLIDPGERVITRPLIYNDLVWFVSSAPTENPCAGGAQSYLYVFEYKCKQFPPGLNPLEESPNGTDVIPITYDDPENAGEQVTVGVRGTIGHGIAAEPTLSSSGDQIIVQASDGQIHTFGDPALASITIEGWLEKIDDELLKK
jgi:type IV pilus assembly protein PilY1